MQRTHHCPLPHRRMGLSARRYYGSTSLRAKNDRYPVSKQSCSLFQRCYAWWSCRISPLISIVSREGNGAMGYPRINCPIGFSRNEIESKGLKLLRDIECLMRLKKLMSSSSKGIGLDNNGAKRVKSMMTCFVFVTRLKNAITLVRALSLEIFMEDRGNETFIRFH